MRGGQSSEFPPASWWVVWWPTRSGTWRLFVVAGVASLLAAVVAVLVLPDFNADVSAAGDPRELPSLVRADEPSSRCVE